jgi:hypothetical protein
MTRAFARGFAVLALVAVMGCDSGGKSPTPDGAAGVSGSAGRAGGAGTTGSAGNLGGAGSSGSAGTTGGAGTSGSAGTTGGGGSGTQPIGAACANTGNCSQADGTAVCCLQISTCVLDTQCPTGTTYVSCETQPCSKAGWVCCNQGGMRFCTKQSACSN